MTLVMLELCTPRAGTAILKGSIVTAGFVMASRPTWSETRESSLVIAAATGTAAAARAVAEIEVRDGSDLLRAGEPKKEWRNPVDASAGLGIGFC